MIRIHTMSFVATCCLCMATTLFAQQSEVETPGETKSRGTASGTPVGRTSTEDLVFLGLDHPVFVRLIAYIDGREIRAARTERIVKLLTELDDNRDGQIDQTERQSHPKAFRSLGIPEKWGSLLPILDVQPKDERINAEEIALFVNERYGPSVTLTGRVRRGSQAVELFDLLDADRDQRLTEAELSEIPSRLKKLDSDGDDAFSIIEVEPFRNPFGAASNTRVSQEDVPWSVSKTSAELLLERFDLPPKDDELSAAELGQPLTAISMSDSNGNGTLSLTELQKWLQTVTPQFELTTNAFRRKAGRTEVTWHDLSWPPSKPGKPDRELGKSLDVNLDGTPFRLEMSSKMRTRNSDSVNFYRNQFRVADADKNMYLDKSEFNQFSMLGASFEMLDTDENGQIYEPELVDYLSLESLGEQNRVILSVDRNEQSLFSLLDKNSDRRLTSREMLSTFEHWQSFDHDGDRVLNRSELSGRMRMIIELPKPKLFQSDFNQSNEMGRDPIIQSRRDGPVWFQGMDVNQDGDVSHLEFLGTDSQFNRWDRDRDGLISAAEANGS